MGVPAAKYSLLEPGFGPLTVVNTATTTGATFSNIFTVSPGKSNGAREVTFTATGTFSVFTFTVQVSQDGGTTWNAYSTADTGIDIHAANPVRVTDLVPGYCYQLTVASFTGTSGTVQAECAGSI
jgi:hypothetical protein